MIGRIKSICKLEEEQVADYIGHIMDPIVWTHQTDN